MLSKKLNSDSFLNISRYCAICAVSIGPFSAAVTSVTCITMALSWLASGQVFNRLKFSLSQPTGTALAIFLFALLLGSIYSPVDFKQSATTLWSWRKLAYILILLSLFNTLYWKERFISFFIVCMLIALTLSFLAWFELIPSKRGPGIMATNYAAQSLAFVCATICCIVQFKDATSKSKLLYAIAIVLFSINILYVSESRTGYLALVVGALIACLLTYGKKKAPFIILTGSLILLITIFSSHNIQSRVEKGVNEMLSYQNSPTLTSIGIRVVFAKNTLQIIKQKPIFGYGTGSFGHVYKQHVANKHNGWRSSSTTDPHNQYLFILTENGIIGLILFFGFIITAIRQGLITDKFGTIGASVLFAWLAASLFNSNFKTFIEGHLLALFLGAMLASIPSHSSDT